MKGHHATLVLTALALASNVDAGNLLELALRRGAILPHLAGLEAALSSKDNFDALVLTIDGGERDATNEDEALLASLPSAEREALLRRESACRLMMRESPTLVVADGALTGAAAGLFLAASHRICTEATLFDPSACRDGLCPGFGTIGALADMPQPHVAMACALGALPLGACDLMELGLATHFVRSASLGAMTEELRAAPAEYLEIPLTRRGMVGAAPKTLVPLYAAEVCAPLNEALLTCFGPEVTSVQAVTACVAEHLEIAAAHADALAAEPCGIHIRTRERADAVRDALRDALRGLTPRTHGHAVGLTATREALLAAIERRPSRPARAATSVRELHAQDLELDLVLDALLREQEGEAGRLLGEAVAAQGEAMAAQGEALRAIASAVRQRMGPPPAATGALDSMGRLRGGATAAASALPPPPWAFPRARLLYQPTLVREADARANTPLGEGSGLRLLSLFGWTLGGVFAVEWRDSPLGPYREVAVLSGLVVSSDLRLGAWASHIVVTSPEAAEAGRCVFGLPAQTGRVSLGQGLSLAADGAAAAAAEPQGGGAAEAAAAWRLASTAAVLLKTAAGTAVPGVAEPAERMGGGAWTGGAWTGGSKRGGVGRGRGRFEFLADDHVLVSEWFEAGGADGGSGGADDGSGGAAADGGGGGGGETEGARAGGGGSISLPSFSGLLPTGSDDGSHVDATAGRTPLLRYPLTLGPARSVRLRAAMRPVCAPGASVSDGLRAVLRGPCAAPCLELDCVNVVAGKPVQVEV